MKFFFSFGLGAGPAASPLGGERQAMEEGRPPANHEKLPVALPADKLARWQAAAEAPADITARNNHEKAGGLPASKCLG